MKVTSLFSVIKAKYQLQHYGTEKEKIEYNYLCFWSKNFPCLKFYFLFPGNGKDLKTSLTQNKTKKHDRTCILSRCSDTDFMQTGNLYFLWGRNSEQKCFWATRDNRKWKYLFSFLYTSKLTNLSLLSVFTLIMRHDLPENLGKTTAQE